MNKYEELFAKASACLSAASAIEDSAVRARVLELVYQAQLVAQEAILREIEERRLDSGSANAAETSGQPTDPLRP
jgi:hypothetical protein